MLHPTPRVSRSREDDLDELTVRTLFDSEEAPLMRYAHSIVRQRAVAEDIVQDAFLRLHARWEEVESPRAWLFRAVRNRAYDHLRNHRKDGPVIDEHVLALASEDTETPDGVLQRLEAAGLLRCLLEELNETDRRLIALKYYEGRSYREMSQATGLSIGNVGYRLHHILKNLAAKLRPLGIDELS